MNDLLVSTDDVRRQGVGRDLARLVLREAGGIRFGRSLWARSGAVVMAARGLQQRGYQLPQLRF